MFKRILAQGSLTVATVATLALAACGSTTSSTGTSSGCKSASISSPSIASEASAATLSFAKGPVTSHVSDTKAIILGTDLPVSGTDASIAKPTEQGVDLAVMQNADLGNGYTLSVLNKNDEGTSGADPAIGAQNISDLIANSSVMAVVGPFNSGVAKSEIPLINNAGLTEISPSNTNPGLTKQQYAASNNINFTQLHPAGKPEAYFRIPATDEVQGKVNGDYAYTTLNLTCAYVVDDKSTYGIGLATQFKTEYTAKGGIVVGNSEITPDQASTFPSLAQTIVNAKPTVVFYGGVTSQGGGALKAAIAKLNPNLPLVGGDGIADDPAWLTTATSSGSNFTYGTVPAPDISGLTSTAGQDFISKFKAQYGADPLPYSAMAYDAALIEITAIKGLIKAGTPVTRDAVRSAVAAISYIGVTGTIKFDANGDNAGGAVYSVYEVVNGAWVFKQEVTA